MATGLNDPVDGSDRVSLGAADLGLRFDLVSHQRPHQAGGIPVPGSGEGRLDYRFLAEARATRPCRVDVFY